MSKPIQVLLVDDQRIITDTISYMMREKGYEVDVAHDAASGLEKAKTKKYDVIFTDYIMPGELGTEMIRKIREFEPTIPVIMITANPDQHMIKATEGLNISGFFSKAAGIVELEQVMEIVLRGIRRSRGDK